MTIIRELQAYACIDIFYGGKYEHKKSFQSPEQEEERKSAFGAFRYLFADPGYGSLGRGI
jgi:hypothetical protein